MTSQTVAASQIAAPCRPATQAEFQWVTIPYWFAATAGLIYATGFLVEFTFQHSLGITSSLDVFKAKYIYVGLQCLQLPASVIFLFFGFWRAKSKQWQIAKEINEAKTRLDELTKPNQDKDLTEEHENIAVDRAAEVSALNLKLDEFTKDGFRVNSTFVIAMAGLLLVYYLTTTFSRPQDWPNMQLPVVLLSVGITLWMSIIRLIEGPFVSFVLQSFKVTNEQFAFGARAILLIPEYVAISVICAAPIKLFGDSLRDGGYFYLLFVLLVVLMLAFLQHFLPVFAKYRRAGALCAMNLSVTFSFLYLSIIAYAYHIYPYLPVTRGGGDYSADPKVSFLTFAREWVPAIPEEILQKNSLQSKPVTVLEDTADAVFVTLEHEQKEREKWRLVGMENKPPVIYALKKDAVVNITYQDRKIGPPKIESQNLTIAATPSPSSPVLSSPIPADQSPAPAPTIQPPKSLSPRHKRIPQPHT
jgi:hypothetical protein